MPLARRHYFPRRFTFALFSSIFFSLYIGGASAMGRAYIRARRSGRGRWCRFLRGIVPGRDAPGSEPTTPLGRDARGSRGCTLAASYVVRTIRRRVCIHRGINPDTHARARALSSWMRRFGARDVSRVTYGTMGAVPEDTIRSRSLRVYDHCSAYAPWDNTRIGYVSFARLLLDCTTFARSRPAITVKIS